MNIETYGISPKNGTIVPMTMRTQDIYQLYGARIDEESEIGTACLVEREDGVMLVIAEPYDEFRDKYMPLDSKPLDLFSQPEASES